VISAGRHAARFFIEPDRVDRKTAANGNDSDLEAGIELRIHKSRTFMDGHVHEGMPFNASLKSFLRWLSCRCDDPRRKECIEEQHHDDDHERSARKLCKGELPPHEHGQHDTEFENKMGGGELKRPCRRKVRFFAKHGARATAA
jgi:hypothetical protein